MPGSLSLFRTMAANLHSLMASKRGVHRTILTDCKTNVTHAANSKFERKETHSGHRRVNGLAVINEGSPNLGGAEQKQIDV